MHAINGNILAKDFNGPIEVNGINMWNQDAMQFSLYELINAEEKVLDELKTAHQDTNNILLVFPFQCGIKYVPGYHLLNMRDCIGVTTIEELKEIWGDKNETN